MSWQAGSFVLLGLVLLAAFGWYERRRPPAKVLALVASLAALAIIGRLAFAAIPNVKPSTDIVLFAGYALGAVPGFVVGAVFALVSNFFLGQGPWTVWQMTGWGAVGVGGAVLAKAMRGTEEPGRLRLAVVCAAAGLAFGAWMDVYQWTLAAQQNLGTYVTVSGTSLPYNLAHAIGNVVFCLLIGPAFVRALTRYRRRFEVRWPVPPKRAVPAMLAVVALLAIPAAAVAASPASRAARYLERAQNADGGFGAAPGQASNQLHTGWAALGLASAKRNPRDVRRGDGRSIMAYLKRGRGSLRDIGELERTILVVSAAGLFPTDFYGRDLLRDLVTRRRNDGSYAGFTSYTAFGILAFRSIGAKVGKKTANWFVRAQNDDGGFGVSPAAASDADMTGAGLQALAVIGRSRGAAARDAVAWLRDAQNADGGFSLSKGGGSNSQSTAYAVTGLVAVDGADDVVARGLGYLRARQQRDGSIAYSATGKQTPVWVTAQALLALRRAPLPLAEVPRKRRRARGTPDAAAGGAASARSRKRAGPGSQRSANDISGGSTVAARRPDPAPAADGAAPVRRASAEQGADGGGPSVLLVVVVAAGSLGVLWICRRYLRARLRGPAGR